MIYKERIPAFALEDKKVILIRDPYILGIYTFTQMMMDQDHYDSETLINKMAQHFLIEEEKIVHALKIITEDLKLLSYKTK